MGSGTTAVACKEVGITYVGSELSAKQCKWAEDRIDRHWKVNFNEWIVGDCT